MLDTNHPVGPHPGVMNARVPGRTGHRFAEGQVKGPFQVSNLEPFGLAVAREDSAGNLRVRAGRRRPRQTSPYSRSPASPRPGPMYALSFRRSSTAATTTVT